MTEERPANEGTAGPATREAIPTDRLRINSLPSSESEAGRPLSGGAPSKAAIAWAEMVKAYPKNMFTFGAQHAADFILEASRDA